MLAVGGVTVRAKLCARVKVMVSNYLVLEVGGVRVRVSVRVGVGVSNYPLLVLLAVDRPVLGRAEEGRLAVVLVLRVLLLVSSACS